ARGSCLKGDDCPYDHELSKYPCHNFVENGMCFRGDKCKFSHVVPTADGPSKPDAKKSDASLVSEKPGREQTSSQKASTVHDGERAEEGDKNGIPNKQRSAPLFDEKNSSKEASSHPSSDPERTSLPTGSTTVLGSLSTQHEVSEASRILQEFLFGAGS
uniref:C3H1-type domain-containing protein n=1 Tax=Aegilops tauschii subsp. strangulata TaxID=200361 RepID=A0A453EY05_AEGTS